jgi:hypothetical protein
MFCRDEGMTKTHRQMEAERQTSLVGLDPTLLDPMVMSRHHQELETEAVLDGVVHGIPAADPARLCHGLAVGRRKILYLVVNAYDDRPSEPESRQSTDHQSSKNHKQRHSDFVVDRSVIGSHERHFLLLRQRQVHRSYHLF